jgi:2-polyprenyl-6-methoxyphenol hydroxylase-like FAD-dependent oxidoreductase
VHKGASLEFRLRLVIGADGRNSSVRKDLSFKVSRDEPRALLGGMLVKGVPSWPRDMQVIGVEDRFHFLIFPQGDDLLRLYGSYQFADKSRFDGPDRRTKLIDAFGSLTCLPYAEAIAASTPIGPFNSTRIRSMAGRSRSSTIWRACSRAARMLWRMARRSMSARRPSFIPRLAS